MARSLWTVAATLVTVMVILVTAHAEEKLSSSSTNTMTSSTEFIFTVSSNGFSLDNFKMNLHMYFGQLANDPTLENLKQSTDNQGDTVLTFSFGGDSAQGYTDGVVNFCTNNDCNDAATTPMGQQFQSSGMPLYSISVIHNSQPTTAPPPATTSAPPPPPSTSFDFTMADAGFTITKFIAALESYFKLGQVSVNGHSATQGPMLHYTFTFSGATATAYTGALVAYCDNKNNDCGVNPQKLILAFEEQELQLYFIYVITPTTAAPTTTLPPTTLPPTAVPTTSAPTTAVPTTPTPSTQAPTTVAPTTAAPTPQPTTTHAPTPSHTPSPNLVNFYTDCSTNQCELATCTDTTFTPDVCVGSEGFGFSFNCSNDNKCAELQVFSDDECLERTETSSLVCGSCNRGGANVNNTYYRVDCDGNQSLSIHRYCDPTCTTCKNDGGTLHFPANTCSGSLPEKGWPHLAVGEIRDCQAVRLSTFSDAKCASPIESSVLEQGMCDNNGKSTVICPGFKRLPAPVFPPVVTLPKTTAPPSPPPSTAVPTTAAPTTESPTETPLPTTTFEPTPVPSGTMAPPSPPAPLVTFNATFTSESFVTNFPTTLHAMYHNYRFKVVWEDGSDEKQEEVATLSMWKTFWFMGANGPYLAEQMLNMSTAVLKDQYGITALSEVTPETESPATGEPTTQGPPTEAPTSQLPSPPTTTSGVVPTSQSPSTTNPGTHHPTTQVPATTTTESPTSMEPTATSTQRPTTQAPPTTVSPTGSPATPTPPTLPPLPPATSHTTFSGLWQTVTMYDNFPSSVHQYFPENTFRVTMGGDRVVAHDGTVTDTFHFGGDKKDVDALNEEFVLYSEKKKTAPAYFGLEELSYVAAATPTPKPTSPPPAKSSGLSAGDIGAIVACVLFAVLVGLMAVVKLNGRKKNVLDEAAMVDHLNSTMVTRYDAEED